MYKHAEKYDDRQHQSGLSGKQVAAVFFCCDFWCLTLHHAILAAVRSRATNFLHLSFSFTCTHAANKHVNNPVAELSIGEMVWQAY